MQRSQFDPNLDAMPGAGQAPDAGQLPDANYPTHAQSVLTSLMDRPGETPEEAAARQTQNDSRLAKLLGPAPERPAPPNRWQTIGAGIQDAGSALAQLAWGFHPTHGSGRRRAPTPQPQATNQLGALQARHKAEQSDYENAQARRGLVAAQMAPAMDRAGIETHAKETDQKIEAARGVLDAWSRSHTTKSQKLSEFVSRMYGAFIDPSTGKVIDESNPKFQARKASIVSAAQLELGADSGTADAVVWHALGKAREAEASIGFKESQAGYVGAKTSDIRTGANVAGELAPSQYADKQKHISARIQGMSKDWYFYGKTPQEAASAIKQLARSEADEVFGGGGGGGTTPPAPNAAPAQAAPAPGAPGAPQAPPQNPAHVAAQSLGALIKQAREAGDYTELVRFLDSNGHPASEFDQYPDDASRNKAIDDVAKSALMAIRDFLKGAKQLPNAPDAGYDPSDNEPAP